MGSEDAVLNQDRWQQYSMLGRKDRVATTNDRTYAGTSLLQHSNAKKLLLFGSWAQNRSIEPVF